MEAEGVPILKIGTKQEEYNVVVTNGEAIRLTRENNAK